MYYIIAGIIISLAAFYYSYVNEIIEPNPEETQLSKKHTIIDYCYNYDYYECNTLTKPYFIATIISLAQKGYIKIISKNDNKKRYYIEYIKEYQGTDNNIKEFIKKVFNNKLNTKITIDDINNNLGRKGFYIQYKGDNIVDHRKNLMRIIFIYVLWLTLPISFYYFNETSLNLTIIKYILLVYSLSITAFGLIYIKRPFFLAISSFDLVVILYEAILVFSGEYNMHSMLSLIATLLLCLTLEYYILRFNIHNKESNEEFKILLNIKEYMEQYSGKESEVFYKYLPYSYLFKMNKEWINKFSIDKYPKWFESDEEFLKNNFSDELIKFNKEINRLYKINEK